MKKSFRKFVSVAAAVSMLGTVASFAVSAEEAVTADAKSEVYYVDKTATSVADFALEGTGAKYVFVPETVTTLGNEAFLTTADIKAFVEKEKLTVSEANKAEVLKYVAKTVKFKDKTEGWTDEELADLEGALNANLKAVGFETVDENNYAEAIVALIKESNKADSKLTMSEDSKAAFGVWSAAIPYSVTVIAPAGSAAAEYAAARTTATSDVTPKIAGDASGDGKISVQDCITVAKTIAQGGTNPIWADYNGDGVVNVLDAANMAKDIAAGKFNKK